MTDQAPTTASRHSGSEESFTAPRPPRLLVLSYLFPPDQTVGGRRWGAITKHLAREGWTIDVVTGGAGGDGPTQPHGLRVHRVPKATTLNDRYVTFASRRSRVSGPAPASSPPKASPDSSSSGGVFHRLKRGLAVAMRYPDYSRGWTLRAARTARRIIRAHDVDLVVSSGPPHTAHVAAMLATRGTDAAWIVDLRDPWAEMFRGDDAAPFLTSLTRRLESAAFHRSCHIVCNTREFRDTLEDRNVGPVSWIPNGIDLEELPEPRPPDPGGPVLAYVGTLYFNRDLGPIIEAMRRAHAASASAAGLKLRFAGHADQAHATQLDSQVLQSGMEGHVERLGSVSREEAQAVLLGAHLCLVLAQRQPMQVPAKMYEAIGLGLRTLVVAEADSAAAREAERVGALCRDPSDIEGIVSVILDLCDGTLPPRIQEQGPVDYRRISAEYGDLMQTVAR